MSDYLREARERWTRQMPGARQAQLADAQTAFQIATMDSVLALVDMALEDEGVPADVRRRVIRTVVYGSPNPADAILREHQMAEMKRAMAETPPSVLICATCLRTLLPGKECQTPRCQQDLKQFRAEFCTPACTEAHTYEQGCQLAGLGEPR